MLLETEPGDTQVLTTIRLEYDKNTLAESRGGKATGMPFLQGPTLKIWSLVMPAPFILREWEKIAGAATNCICGTTSHPAFLSRPVSHIKHQAFVEK